MKQYSVILQCVNGDDIGMNVLYKGTSIGMQNAMKGLIDVIITQVQADPDSCVPVIDLQVDSYPHKQWGKVFIPILEIVNWMTMTGDLTDSVDESEVDTTEDEPPLEPDQAAQAEEKPTRRRRRRAS